MQHKDEIILEKIIDEINIALDAMKDRDFNSFDADELFKRGICMTVINIGELVKNLSPELRVENNHIPWKAIAGFRDMAAHKYGTLVMSDVYDTVTNDFPSLKENITDILSV